MLRIIQRFHCIAATLLCSAAMAQAPAPAASASYPTRPITIVVPFAPAGSNDIIARAIAQEMSVSLKQPVVVDNRPGAGGMLGAGLVARAQPDGYTLMLASSTLTIGGALKAGLPFDARKDITPISLVASGPLMLVASTKFPAKTPAEFVALARSAPGKLTFGSSGTGSLPHMGVELLAIAAGIQLLHVPYKGGAPVLNDIIGGQVDLYLGSLPQVLPLVRAGKLHPIGVTSPKPIPLVPDVPAFSSAVPGFSFDLWWGVFGPGNMPRDLVTRLNGEVAKALQSASMRKFMETEGVVAGTLSAEQFSAVYAKELQEWETVGKKANVRLD